MESAYSFASEAIAAALTLRLGTHFRIMDGGGQIILDDCVLAPNEV
jgi:hypothetical protein